MSDEFLKVARQEIQLEINELEHDILRCSDDKSVFENSQSIESHLHKISGLAPMAGQEKIGQIAKIIYKMLKEQHNDLTGSYHIISNAIEDMKKIFHGADIYDISELKRQVHDRFPHLSHL